MTSPIDPRLFSLYDDYCHSGMGRREFLRRAAAVGGVAAALTLLPDYAKACQVSFTDERIVGRYVRFPSPGGNGQEMRAYLAQPRAEEGAAAKLPAVLVVHENRGLNPYVEDVARRLAVAGFLALAPDALWAVGGYPGNDDEGKALQRGLDRDRILVDMVNSAEYLRTHPSSNGKLGAVGFCFGGLVCNHLAVTLGDRLAASVPFYGRPPALDAVPPIRCKLLLQYAEHDDGVNGARDGYQAALRSAGVQFTAHEYPGTKHGFHNDSTPRFDKDAAELAWSRTLELFRGALSTGPK